MTEFTSFDQLFPGRFLKAGLLNGQPVTYTIKNITREELEGEKGPEPKIVMAFDETPLALVLAKVNAVAVKAMFGADVQQWIGKRVTLYGTTAIMPLPTRKNEPCIRVYGSPDITEEIRCEWTPPRRRPIIQILKPVASATLQAAMGKVEAATSIDELPALLGRAAELTEAGKLTAGEYEQISGAIDARHFAISKAAVLSQLEGKTEILRAFAKKYSVAPKTSVTDAICTQEHVDFITAALAGEGAPEPSDATP